MRHWPIPIILCALAAPVCAADPAPAWTTDGPRVDDPALSLDLPLEFSLGQLYVDVEVGGARHRFLFDTGSPSMLSADLAAELALPVVGHRQGRDSHGAVIETDIVQAELGLGSTTLHSVPVFVASFPKTARCLFDGVLGSEVLPLCAWQIDVPAGRLRCHSELGTLEHIDDATRVPLHDFGSPHAPIIDLRFAEHAQSKGMFDTGTAELLTLSPPDFDGARHNGAVSGIVHGAGSRGGSIGGRAPERPQLAMTLSALAIGDVALGPVRGVLREVPPSLIGTALLRRFIVTLDPRAGVAFLDRYDDAAFDQSGFGLGLDFEDGARVAMVWEDSPAARAQLHAGQPVAAINGRPVDDACATIEHARQAMAGDRIELELDSGTVTLAREAPTRSD